MKRDMDLVRSILIAAEKSDGPLDVLKLCESGISARDAAFQVELMEAHGLIEATCKCSFEHMPTIVKVKSLTWEGYDYLDAIRSDSVWQRSKAAIKEAVGDAPLSVIKEVCSELASAMIKSNLGI